MKELMQAAIEEINNLRRSNDILNAKVSTMELFALVLNTKPAYPSIGMGEDIAWKLQKAITEMEKTA